MLPAMPEYAITVINKDVEYNRISSMIYLGMTSVFV